MDGVKDNLKLVGKTTRNEYLGILLFHSAGTDDTEIDLRIV